MTARLAWIPCALAVTLVVRAAVANASLDSSGASAEVSRTTSAGPLSAGRRVAWLGSWPSLAALFCLGRFLRHVVHDTVQAAHVSAWLGSGR